MTSCMIFPFLQNWQPAGYWNSMTWFTVLKSHQPSVQLKLTKELHTPHFLGCHFREKRHFKKTHNFTHARSHLISTFQYNNSIGQGQTDLESFKIRLAGKVLCRILHQLFQQIVISLNDVLFCVCHIVECQFTQIASILKWLLQARLWYLVCRG